jgi:hypothetical protein
MAISGCQFIREIRQAINIRYASMRMAINFIKNTRIGTLKIMHPFEGGAIIRAFVNRDYLGDWFARITHERHSPFACTISKALS